MESKFILGYDDARHLQPFSQNPIRVKDSSPTLVKELAYDVRMVVDKFHFNENHTGADCAAYCSYSPHALDELSDANTQVAEQSFKRLASFKHTFRYMNKVHFNFMLMLMCKLTRKLNSEFRKRTSLKCPPRRVCTLTHMSLHWRDIVCNQTTTRRMKVCLYDQVSL